MSAAATSLVTVSAEMSRDPAALIALCSVSATIRRDE